MYFITGLPRSRTAWLANFLTHGDSFCFHELLKTCEADNIVKTMKDMPYQYVGNSDSGLPFFMDKISLEDFNVVVIERDKKEVIKSLKNLFQSDDQSIEKIVESLENKIQYIKNQYNPLIVDFNMLNDLSICETIWKFCLPTIPFDVNRWQLLNQLKIETKDINSYNINNIKEVRSCLG